MNFFTRLFAGGSSVLGVDIGSSAVKIVELSKKGSRAKLETYGELSLGPYAALQIGRATSLEAARLSEALRDILAEAKARSTRCGVAVPLSSSLVRTVEMPALGKELVYAVPLEARKYIPVPIGEVSLEWVALPAEGVSLETPLPGKRLPILIAAIHNDALTKFESVIKASGLESSFYEIEAFSAVRSSAPAEKGAYLLCDLGAGASKFYFVNGGIIQSTYIVSRGSQDITLSLSASLGITVNEAEKLKRTAGLVRGAGPEHVEEIISLVLIHIFGEASKAIESFEKKNGVKIQKIIFAGGGALLKDLIPLAGRSFEVSVELANPFSRVESPAFVAEVLRTVGPAFAVAVGAALRRLEED